MIVSAFFNVQQRSLLMPKLRKMLNDVNADYIQELMKLIESQSKETIALWCINYATEHFLPIWQQEKPNDTRPLNALNAAKSYLDGNIKLTEAKKEIMLCRTAARETVDNHIAHGIARTIDAAASTIHNPAGSISIAFYGALTLAYHYHGLDASWEILEQAAISECHKMIASFKKISIENEPNPAKITWGC